MGTGTASAVSPTTQHKSAMSSRERWLAALDCRPLDRLPFWPKIGKSYAAARTGRFAGVPAGEVHRFVGSDLHERATSCVRTVRAVCSQQTESDDHERVRTFQTPHGRLREVSRYDVGSGSWHPTEFAVKTVEDVKAMTAWYADARVELDVEGLEKARAQLAESERTGCGIRVSGVTISPLMEWIQHLAGVQNGHFMLLDHPEEVEALLAAMGRFTLAKARLVAEHQPADLVYMTENTSTSLISPEQYRKYCQPILRQVAEILHAGGKRLCLHMCGLLLDILLDISEVGADAWEAFTSPTLGNTRLADGRAADAQVCIIGGTNAMMWTRPAGEIIAEIERDLDVLPHHRGIVVTSAGVMPPPCEPETVKAVADWLRSYEPRS